MIYKDNTYIIYIYMHIYEGGLISLQPDYDTSILTRKKGYLRNAEGFMYQV